jgi:hypothetical protein
MFIVCGVTLAEDNLECGIDIESEFLCYYHEKLNYFLSLLNHEEISLTLIQRQYEIALLDFVRFLAGN